MFPALARGEIVFLLVVLGFAAIVLGVALFLFDARRSGRIFVLLGLIGVVTLFVDSVFSAVLREEQRKAEVGQYRAQAEQLGLEARGLQARLSAEVNAHGQTRGELEQVKARRDEYKRELDDANARLSQLASDVKRLEIALAFEKEEHAQTKGANVRTKGERDATILALNEKLTKLDAELRAARERIQALEPGPCPTCAESDKDTDLRSKLDRGVTELLYRLRATVTPPTVIGRSGSYYSLVLIEPRDMGVEPKPFEYNAGRCSLTAGEKLFLDSLSEFTAKFIVKIHGRINYEFFVRGGADAREFKTQPSAKQYEELRVIKYLPRKEGTENTYHSEPKEYRLGKFLRNADLPNLRAACTAKLLREALMTLPSGAQSRISILEQVPKGLARAISPEIFLLISWPR